MTNLQHLALLHFHFPSISLLKQFLLVLVDKEKKELDTDDLQQLSPYVTFRSSEL